MNIEILCDEVIVSSKSNDVKATLVNASLDFVDDEIYKLVARDLDLESLFEMMIEKDENLLHDYLQKSGYVYNKI